jgi:hypothetical protein
MWETAKGKKGYHLMIVKLKQSSDRYEIATEEALAAVLPSQPIGALKTRRNGTCRPQDPL